MNRMEEYQAILSSMEPIPEAVSGTFMRAKRRRNRTRRIWKSFVGAAAAFCLFVGLVNLSPSVAAACKEIPLLDKLAEAVMFSSSLQKAVENEYVQPLGLEETKNGVTVRVEHVIVDQKQVNIFYSVASDTYEFLTVRADVWKADVDEGVEAGIVFGDTRVSMGELRHIMVDMASGIVPSQMRLMIDAYTAEKFPDAEEPTHEQWDQAEQTTPVASFEMMMSFDPYFTEQGRALYPNQPFTIDGNTFTVAEVGIYPSHIRIHLDEDPNNDSWIKALRFYLELEDGTVVGQGGNSISAWGDPNSPSMTTYMAESSFFDQNDQFHLIITGADFLEKDFGLSYIDLKTKTARNLPAGYEFVDAVEYDDAWELNFCWLDDGSNHTQAFVGFYDENGEEIESNGMWWNSGDRSDQTEEPVKINMGFRLKDIPGNEVWLEPNYSYFWYADQPVVLEIK